MSGDGNQPTTAASTAPAQTQPQNSNLGSFKIIESTLREGELFANAAFDPEIKVQIAKALDSFGVDYIELTSPVASEQSYKDCQTICNLGLKAKILTHVRCNMDDAKTAVATGVNGVNLIIETSSELSNGKSLEEIKQTALEVIAYVKSQGVEARFSSEDSFRSDLDDLLSLYKAVDSAGVDRLGISDTVGGASPRMVYDHVRTFRGAVRADIETLFHDDTGFAVANAHSALEAGATHVSTSVLGIGQRGGITPLGAFMARMIVTSPDYVKANYNIKELKALETLVAEANVPFNNPLTGFSAFTHKAGIHSKAILNNPSTYEVINPEDFGLSRHVSISSRITGWNAVKSRVEQLGLTMTDDQVKEATAKIKQLADVRPLTMQDTDNILHEFHADLQKA
ncbi:hypothetical protein ACJZ2D_000228 [Fusarium nematophilum]